VCNGPEPGSACDDGDVCTTGDVIQTDCTCAGTFTDTDNDGTCDANDLCNGPEPGSACDDGDVCTIGDVIQTDCTCSGTFEDTDNDGVCNAEEVIGCTDINACNYNFLATDSADCTYPLALYLDCDGNCLNDVDVDGVCDEIEIEGCTDENACNFDSEATEADSSCLYPLEIYLDCNGDCINDADADGVCDESLDIPEGLSPNNDNSNDFFVIPAIELYPNNSLTIINRQGRVVYKSTPYKNEWDGKNNQGQLGGQDDLPEGTYFYEFSFGDGLPTKKGFVYLKRN
jgi:gliding motility-associated-like protein